jgi:hypothetical protein
MEFSINMMYIRAGIPGTKEVEFSINRIYIRGGIPGKKGRGI